MENERYAKQLILPQFGDENQKKIKQAKIIIVGLGGLGVPVIQYLTAMGVGSITILDGDSISLNNLHRQVLYDTSSIGKYKVEVAKKKMNALNPEVHIEALSFDLSSENAHSLIANHDLVVDCTDNLETRYLIDDLCEILKKPFVYAALYQYEGQVSTFHYRSKMSYSDVFPHKDRASLNCSEIGTLGVLPGLIGCYQAMEVIKILTGIGDPLDGKLMMINMLDASQEIIQLKKNKNVQPKSITKVSEITWKELGMLATQRHHFIDIRIKEEYDKFHDPRFENIMGEDIASFEPEKKKSIVITCARGISAKNVAKAFAKKFENKVYVVKGGYSSYD